MLYSGHDMPVTVGTKREHKPKNRFANIVPCMNEILHSLYDVTILVNQFNTEPVVQYTLVICTLKSEMIVFY